MQLETGYRRLQETVKPVLRRKAGGWLWSLIRLLLIIGISYVFLFPVLYMISMSIRSPETVNDPSAVWIPRGLSLESIRVALDMLNYRESVVRTLLISVAGTAASLVSCSLVGYGFARFRFPLKNLFFAAVVLTIIVPPATISLPSFMNFQTLGISNTIFVFVLPALFASGLRSGLFIFIFRQFFSGMPGDLEEAARIDGCGYLKTFVRIILPLAVPAIVTVTLFSFIWHWNEYYLSAMYFQDTEGSVMPLSVMLYNLQANLKNDPSLFNSSSTPDQIRTYLQAGCLLLILPPLILYLFTQRFFTESIERTGIVG